MAVIKSQGGGLAASGAVVLDLGDLRRQADDILARARAEAADVLTEARAEAQALVDAADARGYETGRARGHAEGIEAGTAEGRAAAHAEMAEALEALQTAWDTALGTWERERADMLLAAREDVLAFALAVARKVVLRQIEVDPALVADQVAAALSLLSQPTAVAVRVHPDDRALVESALPALVGGLGASVHATLEEDEAIARGGCIVGAAGGEVDATIETQMDRIVATLLPARAATDDDGEAGGLGA